MTDKKRSSRTGRGGGPKRKAVARPRRGLPDPASVLSEDVLVSPSGRRYRILHTDERDASDKPEKGRGKP